MNGSGANTHTVSPKQVQRLVDAVFNATSKFKTDIEGSSNDFFIKMSKYWEDEKAVDFAKKFKEKLDLLITDLGDSTFRFNNSIVDIANRYSRAAGKGNCVPVIAMRSFSSAIDISPVKTAFEDGDSFGLKDENSLNVIEDAYKKLLSDCDRFIMNLHKDILSINAYGNSEVKAAIDSQASSIFRESGLALAEASRYASQELKMVAIDYKKVSGSYSGGSNGVGSSFSGSNSFYNISNFGGSNNVGGTNGNGTYTSTAGEDLGGTNANGTYTTSEVITSFSSGANENKRSLEDDKAIFKKLEQMGYKSTGNVTPSSYGLKDFGSDVKDFAKTVVTDPKVLGSAAADMGSDVLSSIKDYGSDVKELAKTAVSDPKLFGEAFISAIRGK